MAEAQPTKPALRYAVVSGTDLPISLTDSLEHARGMAKHIAENNPGVAAWVCEPLEQYCLEPA